MSHNAPVADVIIVGAGVIGLMTAWELQKAGKSVVILDRVKAGREASWAGGGILSRLSPWHYPDTLEPLVSESQALYPELCEELHAISDIDPEWIRSGLLCISDDDDLEKGMQWARRKHANFAYVPLDEMPERFPQLSVNQSALLLNDVAQLRNPRFLRALLRALEVKGVNLIENNPVRKLIIEDGVVKGVQANSPLYAGQIVLACGAWTAELIPRDFQRPGITPIKGQMLLYKSVPGLLSQIVLKSDRYLIPRRDGRILAGSSMEEDGYNKSPTIDIKQEIRAFAEDLLPALADIGLEAHWTGLRPAISDNEPVIGPHPQISGLWLNAGHFRYGLTMAPASAKKLSTQMD